MDLTEADLAYVRANFRPLAELCQERREPLGAVDSPSLYAASVRSTMPREPLMLQWPLEVEPMNAG